METAVVPTFQEINVKDPLLSMETADSLKVQVSLLQQRVAELESQVIRQKVSLEKLVKCGREVNRHGESEEIRRLTNLVAQEKKRRLETEVELEKLKNSSNQADNGKCTSQLGNTLMTSEVQQCFLVLKEQFGEYKNYVKTLLVNEKQELLTIATELKERNQRRQDFIRSLNLHRLIQLLDSFDKKPGNMETNQDTGLLPVQPGKVDEKAKAVEEPPKKRACVDDAAAMQQAKRACQTARLVHTRYRTKNM